VRRPDARSAQIGGPDGISQCFQVSAYSGEPLPSSLARNLLSKDDWRQALLNEVTEDGPEVPVVVGAAAFTGNAEGLAGQTGSPYRALTGPAGEVEGVGPPADAGEEVGRVVPDEVRGGDVMDAPVIDVSRGQVLLVDQGVSHAVAQGSLSL
jgi:hypothetical protein